MKQRNLFRATFPTIGLVITALFAGAGCIDEAPVDDPQLSSTSQEITREEIETLQGVCVPIFGNYWCRVCTIGWQGIKCNFYECPGESSTAQCTAIAERDELSFWYEAENGVLTPPMQAATSDGASSGKSVLVPTSATTAGGSVRFTFDVPAGGRTFYVWGRAKAPSTASNAFEFRIDSGGYKQWEIPVASAWSWSRVFDANSAPGTDTGIYIPAGTHTIRFYRRDTGTQLDRVLLTTNPTFVPTAQAFEAESLPRVAPMQVGATGTSPLATRYMWVPPGAGEGGLFDLDFVAPSDGFYSMWGRVNAPSPSQDSFFVSANLGERALWGLPATTATGWKWAPVTDYRNANKTFMQYFSASGFNFFRFDQREAGAKIDRVFVTNDPGFTPVDYVPVFGSAM